MANIITGKEENIKKAMLEMERILDGQPSYLKGFYYSMRSSGSYKTHKIYVEYTMAFLKYVGKDIKDIEFDDITMYLTKLSVKPDGSLASGSYLVSVYSALKKFFNYLYVTKKITEDPAKDVKRPKPKKSSQVERAFLTKHEVRKCFEYIEENYKPIWKERNRALFTVFLATGIRKTACSEINVSNLDFVNNSIKAIDKGENDREFFLTQDKMDVIAEWIKVRKEYLDKIGMETDALFISKLGERMHVNTIGYTVGQITAITGKHITPHKLRGTFITQAINSGASLYEASKLAGHASTKVTQECYVQGQDEKIKAAGFKATSYF